MVCFSQVAPGIVSDVGTLDASETPRFMKNASLTLCRMIRGEACPPSSTCCFLLLSPSSPAPSLKKKNSSEWPFRVLFAWSSVQNFN